MFNKNTRFLHTTNAGTISKKVFLTFLEILVKLFIPIHCHKHRLKVSHET
ncbi:hypothetical protein LPIBR_30300 [Lacticaseibacillus paracasei]|nr:hypothetical protein LPIBR_30300 [Lacticaseibacillus paracasei]